MFESFHNQLEILTINDRGAYGTLKQFSTILLLIDQLFLPYDKHLPEQLWHCKASDQSPQQTVLHSGSGKLVVQAALVYSDSLQALAAAVPLSVQYTTHSVTVGNVNLYLRIHWPSTQVNTSCRTYYQTIAKETIVNISSLNVQLGIIGMKVL